MKQLKFDMTSLNIMEFLKKEKKIPLKFKDEIKLVLIRLGTLNYDLIVYKIKMSNDIIFYSNIKVKCELNLNFFIIKKTNKETIYIFKYINFIKERNILHILFTVMVGNLIEISIIYIFEGKILNYFIFYEIIVYNFFSFLDRVLKEIQIFEFYLLDKNCIIPKAIIESIQIKIFKKIPDKKLFKYI